MTIIQMESKVFKCEGRSVELPKEFVQRNIGIGLKETKALSQNYQIQLMVFMSE